MEDSAKTCVDYGMKVSPWMGQQGGSELKVPLLLVWRMFHRIFNVVDGERREIYGSEHFRRLQVYQTEHDPASDEGAAVATELMSLMSKGQAEFLPPAHLGHRENNYSEEDQHKFLDFAKYGQWDDLRNYLIDQPEFPILCRPSPRKLTALGQIRWRAREFPIETKAAEEMEKYLKALAACQGLSREQEEAEAVAEAEAKAEADTEAVAEANEKAKAELEAKVKAKAVAEARQTAIAELEARVKADAEAEARVKATTEEEADAREKAKAELEERVKANADAEAREKAKPEDEADAGEEAKVEEEKHIRGALHKLESCGLPRR